MVAETSEVRVEYGEAGRAHLPDFSRPAKAPRIGSNDLLDQRGGFPAPLGNAPTVVTAGMLGTPQLCAREMIVRGPTCPQPELGDIMFLRKGVSADQGRSLGGHRFSPVHTVNRELLTHFADHALESFVNQFCVDLAGVFASANTDLNSHSVFGHERTIPLGGSAPDYVPQGEHRMGTNYSALPAEREPLPHDDDTGYYHASALDMTPWDNMFGNAKPGNFLYAGPGEIRNHWPHSKEGDRLFMRLALINGNQRKKKLAEWNIETDEVHDPTVVWPCLDFFHVPVVDFNNFDKTPAPKLTKRPGLRSIGDILAFHEDLDSPDKPSPLKFHATKGGSIVWFIGTREAGVAHREHKGPSSLEGGRPPTNIPINFSPRRFSNVPRTPIAS